MSSIRPLVTITILVVVGVFLYTKINEGPAPVVPGMNDALENSPPAGVPPLATAMNGATSAPAASESAPTWGDGATADGELTPQWAADGAESGAPALASPSASPTNLPTGTNSTVADSRADLPAVPAIPELPPLATPADEMASPAGESIDLPANIPMAQYPGDASSLDSMTPQIPSPTASPAAIASDTNPLRPTTETVVPGADRYGPIAAEPSSGPSFATSWPAIQGALERQELTQAHAMLSQWYGNPNLSPVGSPAG